MKKLFLLFCLISLAQAVVSQTTLYQESFNSGTPAFTLNASDLGCVPGSSGNNWIINNSYSSFFGTTPSQPAAITGSPNSGYMHICSGLTANATFLAPADGNKLAKMNAPVSTLGATGVSLSFWYLCNGDQMATDSYFGRLYYSTDGGVTWVQDPTTYAQQPNWTQATITNPVFDNKADLRFAFMWVQVSANEMLASDPAFSVDEIKIQGTTATNTITTNAPTPTGPYCAGVNLSVPFTSTGTFTAGNVYTVQLSDASGSFASPVSIGTLSSVLNTGTVSVTLPAGTASGSGYLIRVVSSSPAVNGSNFGPITINASVTPSVSISVNPGTTICSVTSATFTATPVNGGTPTYQWQINGSNVAGATGSTFSSSTLSNNNTVSVVMTSTASCANPPSVTATPVTMQVSSTLTPSVSITANPGNTICAGTAVSFTANPVNGGTPAYQWQLNGTNISGANAATFSSSTLANGNQVRVIMTSGAACASPATATSPAITFTVTPSILPSVSITTSPGTTVCAGTMVTFTASAVNGGTPTYQWQVNGTNITGATGPALSSSTLANGDVVSVTMNSTANCAVPASVSASPITLTVSPSLTPSVTVSANPGTNICAGQAVTFSASPVNGGSPSYQWQVNGNNVTGATGATFTSTALANGDAVAVVMTSTASCAVPSTATAASLVMAVSPPLTPSVSIAANPSVPICAGSNITFTAPAVNGGTPSYQWQVNGSNVAGASSSSFSSSALQNSDVVTVVMTSSSACAVPSTAISSPISVSVNPQVVPSVSATSSAGAGLCAGLPITFTASPVNGGTPTYQWQVNGTNISGATASTFTSSTLSNGDIITVVMNSSVACASPASVTSSPITLNLSTSVIPSVTITVNPGTIICIGQAVSFTAVPVNGGSPQYQWQVNGSNVSGANGPIFTSSTLSSGDDVRVIMTSTAACAVPSSATSQALTMTVSTDVNTAVGITANAGGPVCKGAPVTFAAAPVNGGSTPVYKWYVNGLLVNTTTESVFVTSALNTGQVVTCSMTSSLACASPATVSSQGITIAFSPGLSVDAGEDVRVYLGSSVQLQATENANWTYNWLPVQGLSCTNCSDPKASPLVNTTYIVQVTDQTYGCTGTDSVFVEVYEQTDVFVPSAFSPNNDGANDVLYVRGNGIKDFEFQVYNRYGQQVFRSNSQSAGWDGTFQGKELDSGVFNYLLTGSFLNGEDISQKGNVTLQR